MFCYHTLNYDDLFLLTLIFLLNFRQDSVVTERINYDLLRLVKDIQAGDASCPELLGYSAMSKTKDSIPLALSKEC